MSHLKPSTLTKRFAGLVAVDEVSLEVRPGRDGRPHRPERRRQDHVLQLRHRLPRPGFRGGQLDDVDVTAVPARPGPPRAGPHVPAGPPLQTPLGAGEPAPRPAPALRRLRLAGRPRDPGRPPGRAGGAPHVEAVAVLCELDACLDAPVGDLPYGTQRMVEVARALATEPSVLLLDEPGAGMDTTESAYFGPLLRQVHDAGGRTAARPPADRARRRAGGRRSATASTSSTSGGSSPPARPTR